MFCKNCGKEIDDKAYVCPHCGVKVSNSGSDSDSGSKIGWGVLSFLIPIVGLILYFVWKDERPQTAKICGKCALISVIIIVVIYIIYGIIAGIAVAGAISKYSALTSLML